MPLHTTDALILRTYKLGDSDRIVVFLTRDGARSAAWRRTRGRAERRFGGALEPMTLRTRGVFRDASVASWCRSNTSSCCGRRCRRAIGEALGYVGYFAELMDEWAQDSRPERDAVPPRLGRARCAGDDQFAVACRSRALARYFEYWLLRLQGVYPSLAACEGCGGTLADGARLPARRRTLVCFRCAPAAGALTLSPQAVGFLRGAAALAPARLTEIDLSPGAARELEAAHRTLIAWHLEKELRSTRVLREMH